MRYCVYILIYKVARKEKEEENITSKWWRMDRTRWKPPSTESTIILPSVCVCACVCIKIRFPGFTLAQFGYPFHVDISLFFSRQRANERTSKTSIYQHRYTTRQYDLLSYILYEERSIHFLLRVWITEYITKHWNRFFSFSVNYGIHFRFRSIIRLEENRPDNTMTKY